MRLPPLGSLPVRYAIRKPSLPLSQTSKIWDAKDSMLICRSCYDARTASLPEIQQLMHENLNLLTIAVLLLCSLLPMWLTSHQPLPSFHSLGNILNYLWYGGHQILLDFFKESSHNVLSQALCSAHWPSLIASRRLSKAHHHKQRRTGGLLGKDLKHMRRPVLCLYWGQHRCANWTSPGWRPHLWKHVLASGQHCTPLSEVFGLFAHPKICLKLDSESISMTSFGCQLDEWAVQALQDPTLPGSHHHLELKLFNGLLPPNNTCRVIYMTL